MTLVDYRDRASVLIWVALMGLAAQRFLMLPARSITLTVLGSPVTLAVTATTILGVILAALAATGAEAVLRAHPRLQPATQPAYGGQAAPLQPRRSPRGAGKALEVEGRMGLSRYHWEFWGLPVAVIAVAVLLLPLAPSSLYWVLGLVLTGITLGLGMAGIYHTVDPFHKGYRRARLGLNALTYAMALALFLVVYRTRVRSIISASEVMLISGFLALELLRGSERPKVFVALYAAIAGLAMGQATWVLNYWRLDSLTGGLVLLILFYDVVGLAQHALHGRIRRRVFLEYALITIAAMALIWEFAP